MTLARVLISKLRQGKALRDNRLSSPASQQSWDFDTGVVIGQQTGPGLGLDREQAVQQAKS